MIPIPKSAQHYILAVCALGAGILWLPLPAPAAPGASPWELWLLLVLAALAGGKKLRLIGNNRIDEAVSFSVGFSITFTAMLRFGPSGMLMSGLASCLSSCLFPHRQKPYQILFNVMLTAIECRLSSAAFVWLNGGSLTLRFMQSFPALAVATLVYFYINTLGVATVVALCRGVNPLRLWMDSFLVTAPGYFVSAAVSTAATVAMGNDLGSALLFGSPIAFLIYQSYEAYTRKTAESEQKIETLQMDNAHLADQVLQEAQQAHARKMESIGHLAAGIAHEINTPTQYIGDNTRFLQEAFDDMMRLLDQYLELLEAANRGAIDPGLVRRVKDAVQACDLPYLCEEVPRAIQQSLEGIEHVARIVQAMKEFSHPGTEEMVAVDINRAIDSAVTVSRNEWKYVAELETHYDPELPLVPCLPGDFNQVMLNLIVNAAHAIADKGARESDKGAITISTRLNAEWVEIRVSDTGTGVPASIRSRIFDPFFTTKEVGRGTGQGLAIAHAIIVDKHRGSIDFETEEGRGTTFVVRIPAPAQDLSLAA